MKARVFVVDLVDGPYGNYRSFDVTTDSDGRFNVPASQGRAVKITAYVGPEFGVWNQSGFYQLAAVHPTIDGDTTVEIELVERGIRPQVIESPVLSGTVFEITPQGPRPAGGHGRALQLQ